MGAAAVQSAAALAERTTTARQMIRQQVQDIVNTVDLRADVLTGMSNHRGLDEVLAMLLAIHRRYQQPFCLVVAVIDHFDRINKSCGADVAKPLVRAVARLLTDSARDSDVVAHYRADAFAVAMPQTGLEEAETFCSRLRDAARQNTRLNVELRISAGTVAPEPGDNVEQILARAEAAVAC
jgi:diguanylate cyclase (GGDEF)-like protein